MKKTFTVILAVIAFVCVVAMIPGNQSKPLTFHSAEDLSKMQKMLHANPISPGEFFLTPQNCKGCHGFDPMGFASVDGSGIDVNLYDDWETSMMGLAGKDPLWRAKVSHEILTNPAHSNELQTLCTSCHAPMGHYTAFFKGHPYYTIAELVNDSLGLSGVACGSCHSIGPDSLGQLFTGNIPYDTNKVAYGPFDMPVVGPMQLYVGFTPVKGSHVSEGRMCSSCHTLISNTVDLLGVPTGGTFVEQSTFHEWVNSSYPALGVTCQTCHMPVIEDPVVLATGNIALPGRAPFNQHQFVGANSFMVKLIKQNKVLLNVSAPDVNFDSTLAATSRQLKQNSLIINAIIDTIFTDTAFVSVTLINQAGHKFPSGYPSRRAVLQLTAISSIGDTIFASGLFDSTYEVQNINPNFEPHHDVITSETQSQIYEMVMADVNGNKTTVLERTSSKLKDNRIPPLGFTTFHYAYDTCFIAGDALNDPDFNKNGLNEGTGRDIVHFHIPLKGFIGLFNLTASVFYQTLPPDFVKEMFTFNSSEIDTFRRMFNDADRSPVLVVSDTIQNINVYTGIKDNSSYQKISVWPNPSKDGHVTIYGLTQNILSVKVYNLKGQLFDPNIKFLKENNIELILPEISGIYLLKIITNNTNYTERIVRL